MTAKKQRQEEESRTMDNFAAVVGKTIASIEPNDVTQTILITFTDGTLASIYTDEEKAGIKLFKNQPAFDEALRKHEQKSKDKARQVAVAIVDSLRHKYDIAADERSPLLDGAEVELGEITGNKAKRFKDILDGIIGQ